MQLSEERRNALAEHGAKLGREFWQMPEDRAMERYLYNLTMNIREADSMRHAATGALDDASIHNDDIWDTSPSERHKLQNICRNLYFKDPIARNIINNHVLFVYGGGPSFSFGIRDEKNPDSHVERALARFEAFRRVNDLDRQLKSAFTLSLAMGEYFFIEPQRPEDEEALDFVLKHGILGVRGMESTRVQEIIYDKYDLISPITYILNYSSSNSIEVPGDANRELEADRVMHMRVNAFGIHGRPVLEPVVHYILRANDMLEDRVSLSNTRSRLPIIREIKRNVGAPARELPERSTVLTVPMDKERWTFPSLSLSSTEQDTELGAIYRAIAQGIGLPEIFVTMDLSRAGAFGQLAPIQVQLRRLFEDYQEQFRPVLEDLAHRVCPWIDPDEIRIDFPKPDFATEQMKVDLADRKLRAGLISKRMAIESIGEDPDRVLEEISRESQTTAQPPRAGVGSSGGLGPGGLMGDTTGSDLGLSGGLAGSEFSLPSFPDLSSQSGSHTSNETQSPQSSAAPGAPQPASAPATNAPTATRGVNFGTSPGGVRTTSSLRESGDPFTRIYAGMDFGWDMPGAVVILGEMRDGRLLVLEEYVKSELQMLHSKEPGDDPRECCWVCTLKDFNKKYNLDGIFTDPKDPEAVSMMQDHFEIPIEPISIPVADGVDNMRTLARDGKLLVEKGCNHLHDDATKAEGHALDALRYSTTAMLERG